MQPATKGDACCAGSYGELDTQSAVLQDFLQRLQEQADSVRELIAAQRGLDAAAAKVLRSHRLREETIPAGVQVYVTAGTPLHRCVSQVSQERACIYAAAGQALK
jgi:hypothetical protein